MATSATRAPQQFTINLNIQPDSGDIDATGPFQNQMVIGDTAVFVASELGDIIIEFMSMPGTVDINGKPVPADLLPFGTENQVINNPDPATPFKVVNSCKAWMMVKITTKDSVPHHCPWDPINSINGSTICTGGGGSPVNCH